MILDTENYTYNWFYSNLDYAIGMIMDSLLMLSEGRSEPLHVLLPPVDTAMHRFALYLVVRDRRSSDACATPGEAFLWAKGYLWYTPAYARNLKRSGGGRFF
jgi:hypothetical protein